MDLRALAISPVFELQYLIALNCTFLAGAYKHLCTGVSSCTLQIKETKRYKKTGQATANSKDFHQAKQKIVWSFFGSFD